MVNRPNRIIRKTNRKSPTSYSFFHRKDRKGYAKTKKFE